MSTKINVKQNLAGRLFLPETSKAILWDMDGVLVDSLSLALNACNQLLAKTFDPSVQVDDNFIRSIFAIHTSEFWRLILEHVEQMFHVEHAMEKQALLLQQYDQARRDASFELNPGIAEILQAAQSKQIKMAVVSNNPTADVEKILQQAGIREYFNIVVGNDLQSFEKKPAPDTYLHAAALLNNDPSNCTVIEDSLIGIEAGAKAGCHVVAVATGGTSIELLSNTHWADQLYTSFSKKKCKMILGDVRKKNIVTPNEFVTHMLEHIAWRLGTEIDLYWTNNDWPALGFYVGEQIRRLEIYTDSAAALGMIDDGSAEVSIQLKESEGCLQFAGIKTLDLNWFLALRCEQINSGQPLLEVMQGLSKGLKADLQVTVCSVEDPHHTWEGIFRSIGIALHQLFTPPRPAHLPFSDAIEENDIEGELRILAKSTHYAKVFRGTAESHVSVAVDFSCSRPHSFTFNLASSIDMSEFPNLLRRMADQAGFTMQVEFNATVLSSSHVVTEDTALVMGRALLEILTLRMMTWGVNGAGSSIRSKKDLSSQPVRVALSVEGRKFWLFVPFNDSYDQLKKNFLLGQNIRGSLRSEDLDDFLDGLAGGLACSIIVHVKDLTSADQGWPLIFDYLGLSIQQAFALNPYRKGVPPGVKATLA